MRKWSEAYAKAVRFVCICVDSRPVEVAREFQREIFEGSAVFNGYISDPEDFPTFPTQLGCQGFVVISASGTFATLRSPSLNRVGPQAFYYVERVLDSLTSPASEREREEEEGQKKRKCASCSGGTTATGKAARFSTNACDPRDAEMPLEELTSFELPSVRHSAMDAEHKELETLMELCARTRKASDVNKLRTMFADHAKEEEELMRRSSFGESGDVKKISIFSALTSHKADHDDIVELAEKVASSGDGSGLVGKTDIATLCRRIIEHATSFDSRYAGKLIDG